LGVPFWSPVVFPLFSLCYLLDRSVHVEQARCGLAQSRSDVVQSERSLTRCVWHPFSFSRWIPATKLGGGTAAFLLVPPALRTMILLFSLSFSLRRAGTDRRARSSRCPTPLSRLKDSSLARPCPLPPFFFFFFSFFSAR